jgi:hypothetical protein
VLLNEQQIAEAKERAEQVVNGFAVIRAQQARDALNLAETLELRNKQLIALKAELDKRGNGFGDIFGDVFGNDIFNSSPFGAKGFGQKK